MRFSILALVSVSLLLSACNADNVRFDNESPSFVDTDSVPGIDTGIQEPPLDDAVLNESSEGFVPPPREENITYNGEVQSADMPVQLRGRSAVTLWVWNELGSQRVIMSEGSGAGVSRLKIIVEVGAVSSQDGGRAAVSISGQPARIMAEGEETRFGNTWVYISDILAPS